MKQVEAEKEETEKAAKDKESEYERKLSESEKQIQNLQEKLKITEEEKTKENEKHGFERIEMDDKFEKIKSEMSALKKDVAQKDVFNCLKPLLFFLSNHYFG